MSAPGMLQRVRACATAGAANRRAGQVPPPPACAAPAILGRSRGSGADARQGREQKGRRRAKVSPCAHDKAAQLAALAAQDNIISDTLCTLPRVLHWPNGPRRALWLWAWRARRAQARRFLSHLADATGVPYNDRAFCAVAAFQSPGCMLASDGTRLKSHG